MILRRMLGCVCCLLVCSCTFQERAGKLRVTGCIESKDAVSFRLSPYSGNPPEKLFLGDFDSLSLSRCFRSSVIWKSGGSVSVFGIPIKEGKAAKLNDFTLAVNLGASGVKYFSFSVDSVCREGICDIGIITVKSP